MWVFTEHCDTKRIADAPGMIQETKIKGYINILGYKVVADENVHPGRYGFRIIHDTEKPHYFSSVEQHVVREWMKALMKATIGRDYSSAFGLSCCRLTLTDDDSGRRAGRIVVQHPDHPAFGCAGYEPGSSSSFTHCS